MAGSSTSILSRGLGILRHGELPAPPSSVGRRLLVTRPLDEAVAMTPELEMLGFAALIEPMLAVKPLPQPLLEPQDVHALLFTSANAVRALHQVVLERDLRRQEDDGADSVPDWTRLLRFPVFTVGDATAAVAREFGFRKVESAAGRAEELAALLVQRVREGRLPENAICLHVCGKNRAGDLETPLLRAGIGLKRTVVYKAETARALSVNLRTALQENSLHGVLFFSPRTAETFVSLVREAGLALSCKTLEAYCLSEAVLQATRPLPWYRLHLAPEPNRSSLLSLLPDPV